MKAKELPPLELLREHFCYDPETGEIRRLKGKGRGRVVKTTNNAGYLIISLTINKTRMIMVQHRVAWALFYGEDPGKLEVDHINQVKNDNRIVNLRLATSSQNKLNRPTKDEAYRGLTKTKWGWQVFFKCRAYGTFKTYEEASAVRQKIVQDDADSVFCNRV